MNSWQNIVITIFLKSFSQKINYFINTCIFIYKNTYIDVFTHVCTKNSVNSWERVVITISKNVMVR